MAWLYVEGEMALTLGAILGADNAPALALFQVLRRSSAQREARATIAERWSATQRQPLNYTGDYVINRILPKSWWDSLKK
jgi:hypothetical protein